MLHTLSLANYYFAFKFKNFKISLIFIFILFCFSLFCQEQDPSPLPFLDTTNPCTGLEISTNSVINTVDGEIVYLKFVDEIPNDFVIVDSQGHEAETEICLNSERNVLIISTNNTENKELSIVAPNSCGDIEIVMAINQRVEQEVGGRQITISKEMHGILEQWTLGETPLLEFLKNDESVSVYEKLAFYQEYSLGDAPLMRNGRFQYDLDSTLGGDDDVDINSCNGPSLPSDPPPPPPADSISCRCEVLTVTPNHLKGVPTSVTSADGYTQVSWDYFEFLSTGKMGIPGQSNASYWKEDHILGASSWVHLVTEGWKSSPNQFKEFSHESGTEGASGIAEGYISITLLCKNGLELPEDCNCDKSGTVHYYYEAEAEADAHIKGSGGNRQSKAAVQNQAFAYFYENDDLGANIDGFVPVKGIDVRVESECEAEVNPDFFNSIENLANSVIGAFTNSAGALGRWEVNSTLCFDTTGFVFIPQDTIWSSDSTMFEVVFEQTIYNIDTIPKVDSTWVLAGPTSQGSTFQQLASSIIGVIKTPLHIFSDCSSAFSVDAINIGAEFSLTANKTLTFGLISTYKLRSGGKKSWGAEAKLNSAYSITVHVEPGEIEGPESGCCVPNTAAYLIGPGFWHSLNNSLNDNVARETFAGLFTTTGFSPSGVNGLGFDNNVGAYLIGESGYLSAPPTHGQCDSVTVKFVNDRSVLNQSIPRVLPDNMLSNLNVYDIMGRVLINIPNQKPMSKSEAILKVRNKLDMSKVSNQLIIINFINENGNYENAKIVL